MPETPMLRDSGDHGSIVREMVLSDVPELLRLMQAIVRFERGIDFRLDESELIRRGFGEKSDFGAYVADLGDGKLVGMAVYYEIPFMHSLQPLLMMKWLYVDEKCRGRNIGRRLMRRMAQHARSIGHSNFCWFVLKDNTDAQSFYRGLGATPDPDWDRWMLSAGFLESLAVS